MAGLPRSMPNADQCRSKRWHGSQCWSILINAVQFPSALMKIDRHWEELVGIDRHWLAMIGIERHFGSMPWFWSALISIGHWSRESCNGLRCNEWFPWIWVMFGCCTVIEWLNFLFRSWWHPCLYLHVNQTPQNNMLVNNFAKKCRVGSCDRRLFAHLYILH